MRRLLVYHVFGNLLTNAVVIHQKVAYGHGLTAASGKPYVLVRVCDEGPGLDAKVEIDVRNSGSPLVSGAHIGGFGLQIARSFLRRFDGKMEFLHDDSVSSGGQGCRVEVYLLRPGFSREERNGETTERLVRAHLQDQPDEGIVWSRRSTKG